MSIDVLIEQANASGDNSVIEVEIDKVIATKDKDAIQELGAKLAESGIEEYTLAGSKSYEEVKALMTGQNMGAFSSPIATLNGAGGLSLNDPNFSYNMMSLEKGIDESGCFGMFNSSNITQFESDLPSLTNGIGMFYGCSNLTSFTSELPNLTDGSYMFQGCKLDLASVQNIAQTINNISGTTATSPTYGKLTLGLGCTQSTFNDHSTGWYDAVEAIKSKGWTVAVGYNG